MIVNNTDYEQPNVVKDLANGDCFTVDFENFYILTSGLPADNSGVHYMVNLKTGKIESIDAYRKVRKVTGTVTIVY